MRTLGVRPTGLPSIFARTSHNHQKSVSFEYSHLSTDLPEHCPLSEHRKDSSYQLVCRSEDGFFVWLPLAPLLHKVSPESGVMLNNTSRHQPDHPPEMPVAPLRYPAGPFELA